MNTIDLLQQHRSYRDFSSKPVTATTVSQLITTAQHAATSIFLQAYSFVSITDPKLKAKIAKITTRPFVGGNGHLFIVVADQHRNALLAKKAQPDTDVRLLGSADRFLASVEDATLAAQTLIVAAESLGLGTVVLGSVLNDTSALIELLHLPKLTMPVFGILVGYPNSQNNLKPRLPEAAVHFENGYQEPDTYSDALQSYQQTLQTYYQNRSTNQRQTDFSQIIQGALHATQQRTDLLRILHQQGFLTEKG